MTAQANTRKALETRRKLRGLLVNLGPAEDSGGEEEEEEEVEV